MTEKKIPLGFSCNWIETKVIPLGSNGQKIGVSYNCFDTVKVYRWNITSEEGERAYIIIGQLAGEEKLNIKVHSIFSHLLSFSFC